MKVRIPQTVPIQYNEIGLIWKNRRMELGLTREEVGYSIGVEQTTISKIERLSDQWINSKTIRKFADFLGVTLDR